MKTLAWFRKNWFWALLILLGLWTLPKLVNTWSLALLRVLELWEALWTRAGKIANLPAATVQKLKDTGAAVAEKARDVAVKNPWIFSLAPVALAFKFPQAAVVIGAWRLLDYFKKDEVVNISRNVPAGAPVEPEAAPSIGPRSSEINVGNPFE